MFVGDSADTPQFAIDCLASWWRSEGRHRYPGADTLVVLADGGGSNGYRPRAWKYFLQHTLCNPYGLKVVVAHYPSGCSKWNSIEHRLFSAISINWAGVPLESFETILNYIRTTTTRTGLRVRSERVTREYQKGIKISEEQMRQLNLHRDRKIPQWTYSIHSQPLVLPPPAPAAAENSPPPASLPA